jgi:energy-coupling factor transporter ATP-binding protein EcfA2
MRLTRFKVTKYRNVMDSGWIDVNDITAFVGQNEAGKSNLFEALYRINSFSQNETYNIDEDWPVDDWGNKDASALVCETNFALNGAEIKDLYENAALSNHTEAASQMGQGEKTEGVGPEIPSELIILGSRSYSSGPTFAAAGDHALDAAKVDGWAKQHAPKFVLIQDYGLSGTRIELDQLAQRCKTIPWHQLTNEEQTIKIVLDLAKVNIDEFLAKGGTAEGRTVRSFDKRAASSYLSKQFRDLWTQKKVNFHIEIDGPTLNIFAEDDAVGMPVRLHRRSSGFRWHVSFAWKFTHASQGQYKSCILLLEEPGIHLHYSGQRDLLEVFQRLSNSNNTILYTTHLASMVDPAYPERVRIVETEGNHATVKKGVVSSQRAPMAVIELTLGLTGDMSGLLGTRQTLIVEGGDDALILHKLSRILGAEGKPHLSDRIYLWPARGASKTPMYAAFAVGQGWDSGVLLDTDLEGHEAKKKIDDLVLKKLAAEQQARFRVLMLGNAADIKKTDAAIEDLFDDQFYIDSVNAAFGIAIKLEDLPVDGSDMIAKRAETVLVQRYGHKELEKRRVISEILRRFDGWEKVADLPKGTAAKAEKLFKTINAAFGEATP